jgi:type IV pilus biogenesis protein CpaD/CtpE
MAANPADLLSPRQSWPADAVRPAAVTGLHNQGKVTASEYHDANATTATISKVGQ